MPAAPERPIGPDRHCEVRTGFRPTYWIIRQKRIFTALTVMAGLSPSKDGRSSERTMPGHPRRPTMPQFPVLSAPYRLSIWTVCEPNHVDGLDKPGDDGK